ncbi:MAG: hypothetical protein QXY55_04335 [Candidatus Korarchaeota archaeon]
MIFLLMRRTIGFILLMALIFSAISSSFYTTLGKITKGDNVNAYMKFRDFQGNRALMWNSAQELTLGATPGDMGRAMHIQGYQEIIKLQTSGWTFKNSTLVNAFSNNFVQTRISKNPDKEEYAIGVLRRWRNASGIYSQIDIYIANFTAGDSNIYINHTNFSVPIRYVNSFAINGTTTNELKITRFDLVWKNSTTITVAHIKQYLTVDTGTYIDAYDVAYRSLSLDSNTWTAESTLAKGTGIGYDIKTSWSGANRIIAFIGSNATSLAGATFKLSFAANLFINETNKISVDFNDTTTAKATPYYAYLSNIIFASGCVYIAAALVTSMASELATILWDTIATSINATTIVTSYDLADSYGISVLDFKHPSITPLGSSHCLVSFIGYSEIDNYLIYFRGQFSGDRILPPSPSSTGEIIYEKTLRRASYTFITDNDPSDNETVLMWIDFSEKSIIKYALVQFTDSGLNRTNVSTCVGLSDVVSFDAMFMGSLNITVMLNSTHSSYTLANNSIFIAHISDTGAGKFPYVALGLRDSDMDFLGDCEEEFYTTYNSTSDSDNDGIPDGSEVFVYHTKPNTGDTDNDGLYDGIEIRGIDIPGVGIRQTDPLNPDTDSDGLLDGEEALGVKITNPMTGEIFTVCTNPLNPDTDSDGLLDGEEISGFDIPGIRHVQTDPTLRDTDSDMLTDDQEAVNVKTNPWNPDTDGDGLSDYDEVFKTRTNPRLRDTDGDFIPDNFDILLPTTNDFTYIIVAVMLIGLLRLHSYGLFRNWRRDIIGVGLSDLGGIPMFVLPERFPVEIDISLISSGITGIFTMAGELSQRALNRIVLSGVVPILIDKGEYTLMWVFLRREYPRVIKQLSKLHREMEKTYSAILAEWSGVVEELTDVKSWLMVRLFPGARFEAKKELEALEEEFRETFKEE